MARKYFDTRKVVFPMVRDPERRLYEDYGMLRGSWWANYGPITLTKYLLLMMQGWFPGAPGEDWRQMGGDVLIDPQGIIRLHHASRDPMDRPTVERLFEIIQSYGPVNATVS